MSRQSHVLVPSPRAAAPRNRSRRARRHSRWLATVRDAWRRDELDLYYQPQVSRTGYLVGVEALLRWNRGESIVLPHVLLPALASLDRLDELAWWTIRTAIDQLATWTPLTNAPIVAVNVSPAQFARLDLGRVADCLATAAIPGSRLELELTERLPLSDVPRLEEQVATARELGLRIALDDFGTGASSPLDLLHVLPDVLKIPRRFIVAAGESDHGASVLRALVSLGHDLGAEVVAEGVETERQWEAAASLDIERFQGWRFGRATPGAEMTERLRTRGAR